ncbi:hypothetical protein RRG08_013386 [Elysia crispata]|uniref:Uncharacterized protein n=1 Tax=Elysia crispata TaxID=231223 RepID=A0AAE1B628_9GAST|nr:hypothetical protein RRG08_013386 [Elysia crispata]
MVDWLGVLKSGLVKLRADRLCGRILTRLRVREGNAPHYKSTRFPCSGQIEKTLSGFSLGKTVLSELKRLCPQDRDFPISLVGCGWDQIQIKWGGAWRNLSSALTDWIVRHLACGILQADRDNCIEYFYPDNWFAPKADRDNCIEYFYPDNWFAL